MFNDSLGMCIEKTPGGVVIEGAGDTRVLVAVFEGPGEKEVMAIPSATANGIKCMVVAVSAAGEMVVFIIASIVLKQLACRDEDMEENCSKIPASDKRFEWLRIDDPKLFEDEPRTGNLAHPCAKREYHIQMPSLPNSVLLGSGLRLGSLRDCRMCL